MKTYALYSGDVFGRDFALVDEDGNKLEGVIELTVRAYAGDVVKAEVTIPADRLNMKVALAEVTAVCPSCGDGFTHQCEPQTLGGI